MIREVKFESQDRRIKGIIEALNANGIKDIEEANAICEAAGLDPYKTCEGFCRILLAQRKLIAKIYSEIF